MSVRAYRFIFVIADTQIPFEHQDYLEFCKSVFDQFSQRVPKDSIRVMHVGDEVDQHALGRWPADPNGLSSGNECDEAIARLKPWFDAFPSVSVCTSNHTMRAWKKAFGAGIPSQFLKDVRDVYKAPPGWKWADRWIIDGICFEHGENVSGATAALRAAKDNRMPTVIGHQHTHAGVIYSKSISDSIWGMNLGCGIDVDAYAFSYGKTLRNKPNLGCGVIINGIPYFVPMILNEQKRWEGWP